MLKYLVGRFRRWNEEVDTNYNDKMSAARGGQKKIEGSSVRGWRGFGDSGAQSGILISRNPYVKRSAQTGVQSPPREHILEPTVVTYHDQNRWQLGSN